MIILTVLVHILWIAWHWLATDPIGQNVLANLIWSVPAAVLLEVRLARHLRRHHETLGQAIKGEVRRLIDDV